MSEPKFCKDCRWFRVVLYSGLCHRPVTHAPDVIWGNTASPRSVYCIEERSEGECGPGAVLFEERPPTEPVQPPPPTGWRRLRLWLAGLGLAVLPGCASAPGYADAYAAAVLLLPLWTLAAWEAWR